ncbi:MAG TPA: helix-turn-helix transcriptional regulator [Chloroflexota bacterium]|nr:helix-turn-helix transcriptional regulator [Chloroflexota bacterium]
MPENVAKRRPLRLSPYQVQVLKMLALGYDTDTMADELGRSVFSVHRQRGHILERLNAVTITQAVVIAIKRGLLNLDELEVE